LHDQLLTQKYSFSPTIGMNDILRPVNFALNSILYILYNLLVPESPVSFSIPALTKSVVIQDWGRIAYKQAWDQQTHLHESIIQQKRDKTNPFTGPHYLIFCEHEPVFTLGRSGKENHLLLQPERLAQRGIDFYKINRGGDITYHGPGQVVVYPILDLDLFFNDVHRFIRSLESVIIRVLADYQIEGLRNPAYTGVWVRSRQDSRPKKICALGVHMSRWVTLHGLAFNLSTDLSAFEYIIPCGIADPQLGVTSLQLETDLPFTSEEIKSKIQEYFAAEFDCHYIDGK
jgi:lipoyl(octanoyl) transferase